MGSPAAKGARHYEQRRPEATALYRLVAAHLETFLAMARESTGSLPRYVERELRAYLACGIHAHGFVRARCAECGKELLVAFSCKRRGVCPSCNARRMAATAAHLTDHVLPGVPLRQWVLSVPFELRLLLAKRAEALSAVGRIFVQEILCWQREQAHAALPAPTTGTSNKVRGGAICFPQRFGGSLNLNVHYHVAVPDGVFARDPARGVTFLQLALPNHNDLDAIAHGVELRVLRWLKRRGLLHRADEPSTLNEPAPSALDACLQGSLGVGDLVMLPGPDARCDPRAASRLVTPARRTMSARGFDVHAAVAVTAADCEGRERLLRYCARAPLSLERLSLLPDGRVAYRIKAPQGRRTHRVMTPLQFLARISALIPPPRHPLVRFHGVFAPHSGWRKDVVALVKRPDKLAATCTATNYHEQRAKRRQTDSAAALAPRPTPPSLAAVHKAQEVPLAASIGPLCSAALTTSTPSLARVAVASASSPSSPSPSSPPPSSPPSTFPPPRPRSPAPAPPTTT